MIRFFILGFVFLLSCQNTTSDKEKELLKKELELTKRELKLKEKEVKTNNQRKETDNSKNDGSKIVEEELNNPIKFLDLVHTIKHYTKETRERGTILNRKLSKTEYYFEYKAENKAMFVSYNLEVQIDFYNKNKEIIETQRFKVPKILHPKKTYSASKKVVLPKGYKSYKARIFRAITSK